jgi:hypothetical protein
MKDSQILRISYIDIDRLDRFMLKPQLNLFDCGIIPRQRQILLQWKLDVST